MLKLAELELAQSNNNMTQDQLSAFGFYGDNIVYTEVLKALQESQESLFLYAISSNPKGEERIHACGQADGVNMAMSLLVNLRNEAKRLNGLTDE